MMKIADSMMKMNQPRNFNSLAEAQMFLDKIYKFEDTDRPYYVCTLIRHRPQNLQ